MEPETAQEPMEIESALQEELAIKSEFSYDPDESEKTGNSCPTFKRPLSCCHSVKHLTQNRNWTAMKESTLVRSHSAAQSVTLHSLKQLI